MTPRASSGRYFQGPVDDDRPDVASAARTADGNSTAFNTEEIEEIQAKLNVTAAQGASPTLDVDLETKTENGDWYVAGSFPQQTDADGDPERVFGPLGDQCRWAWDIAGDAAEDAVWTLTVDATAGNFVIGDGTDSETVAFDITNSALEALLEAWASIGSGNVTVTGGPGDDGGTTPYVITIEHEIDTYPTITAVDDSGGTPLSGGGATVGIVETNPAVAETEFTFAVEADIER